MPTINQLVNKPRTSKAKKTKELALKINWNSQSKSYSFANSPQKSGICKKVGVLNPRKPNSANRAFARVVLKNKKEVAVYIPGEKHNLQEYSSVLISGGGAQDLPGVKYHVIRGHGDAEGVKERKQGRSLYGVKKKKLKKVYGGKTVLRDISFSVKKGSIHGFIGPNGAGKTTTLNCLMSGVKPSGGEIYLEGQKIGQDELINQKIGFMTEQAPFSASLRVEDFIHLAGQVRNIPPQQVEQRLRKSDLNNYRTKKCGELSTVLDEPTSGLDPSYRGILLNQLEQVRARGGTVLISSHILSDLQKLVDSVTLIDRGQIIYTGGKPADIEEMYDKLLLKEKIAEKKGQTFI
ncbi:2746_t:CDS:2 [Ambispora gerdemannii]|uniref:2746_t:CDS:1 n=1 Tax=Ambispora gerdemannii TaxID=144530 RepID=A0A9N9D7D1_9GLOM|nr:2746_t:CDS:2 [Ambispora gerdemannii]